MESFKKFGLEKNDLFSALSSDIHKDEFLDIELSAIKDPEEMAIINMVLNVYKSENNSNSGN